MDRTPKDISRTARSPRGWWRFAALAWAALIFAGSSVPGGTAPGRFGFLAHYLEYAVLGWMLAASSNDDEPAALVTALALGGAYAATDELHQAFVPRRMPDPLDLLVDIAGVITGALLHAGVRMLLSRYHSAQRSGRRLRADAP